MAKFPDLEHIMLLPQWMESLLGRFSQQDRKAAQRLLLEGRQAAWQVRQMERINTLADVEFQVTSQWGEDGIIEWLVHFLGDVPPRFVEFGVESYSEANTRFLLQHRNWKGMVMDGSEAYMKQLRADELHWRYDLTPVDAFLTRDNISDLLAKHGFASGLGILSVDIDGNDYWVLERIEPLDAAILIVEYNAVFGDVYPLSVPYRDDFQRGKAHFSSLYYGCSVQAARYVAEKRGYTFIGTNSAGNNAFFVRNDLFPKIESKIGSVIAKPSRFRESRDEAGHLTYLRGPARLEVIRDLPIVHCDTGEEVPLGSLEDPYSASWKEQM